MKTLLLLSLGMTLLLTGCVSDGVGYNYSYQGSTAYQPQQPVVCREPVYVQPPVYRRVDHIVAAPIENQPMMVAHPNAPGGYFWQAQAGGAYVNASRGVKFAPNVRVPSNYVVTDVYCR